MAVEREQSEVRVSVENHQFPSDAVVEAIAAATGLDPLDLPPLFDVVDTDALDAFVARGDGALVEFEFKGCRVTVSEDVVTATYG